MKLLITRPYEDSLETKKLIEAETEHQVSIYPLIDIKILEKEINLKPTENIIITSANGLNALKQNDNSVNYNLYLVGKSSLNKAKDFGYDNLHYSQTSLKNSNSENLAEYIIQNSEKGDEFIHITSKNVKGDLQKLLESEKRVYNKLELYDVVENDFDEQIIESLKNHEYEGLVFFSEKTSIIFLSLIKKYKLANSLENKKIFCLSERISSVFNDCKGLEVIFPNDVNINSFLELLK